MENAADALKMAGAVLIFVLALSIIILALGQVRESADTIIDYRDRETLYIAGDYYYKSTDTVRNVNLETIIPSVYRAYLEEYIIVFEGLEKPLYNIKDKYRLLASPHNAWSAAEAIDRLIECVAENIRVWLAK